MTQTFKSRGVLGNASLLAVTAIFVKFMGLMYKIPLSHILSDEGMGYFNAAYTIYSFLYLLGSAGVPKAITVLMSGSVGNIETERRKIFNVATRFFLLLSLFLFLLLFIFSKSLAFWIGSPESYPTILMISPCLLFVALNGIYRGCLTSVGDFISTAVASVIEATLKLGLGVLFVYIGKAFQLSLPWLCAMSVLGISVGSFVSTVYLKKRLNFSFLANKNEQTLITKEERKSKIHSILRICAPITIGAAVTAASSLIDLSMIMKRLAVCGYTSSQATALYGNYMTLAVPMLQMVSSLLTPVTAVLLPRISAAFVRSNQKECCGAIFYGGQIFAFVSVPIAFLFSVFSKELLGLLFPAESIETGAMLLKCLSVGVIFLSWLMIFNTALEAVGKAHLQMLSMFIGIFVKIPISYFLLGNENYGILGAPIGTVASYAVSFVFSYYFFQKHIKMPRVLLLYLVPCLNSIAATALTLIVSNLLNISFQNRFSCFVLIAVFGILYLLFSVITGVLNFDRIKYPAKPTKRSA